VCVCVSIQIDIDTIGKSKKTFVEKESKTHFSEKLFVYLKHSLHSEYIAHI